jgi:hypothetical protein
MCVINTPKGIAVFRLASVRAQLRLEKAGMKSSGGALRPRLAEEFGLSPRASHDEYISVATKMIDAAQAV